MDIFWKYRYICNINIDFISIFYYPYDNIL